MAGRAEAWRYRALLHAFRLYDWVRRRFTPAGRLLLAAMLASMALGFDTQQSVAYQSFTFLAALLAACMLWALAFRNRFEVGRTLPRFGTAGEPVSYTLRVTNLSLSPLAGLSVREEEGVLHPSFEEFAAARPAEGSRAPLLARFAGFDRWQALRKARTLEGLEENALPMLPPRGSAEVSGTLVPRRRGRLRFAGTAVARRDPLGVFRAFQRQEAGQSMLVLPRRYPVPELRLPGLRRYQQGGIALTSAVGESQEFMSMRDYRPGDPLRRIHWKSWAKAGKPIVKECQDEYFVRHALVLDTFAERGGPVFEEAVSVAASFACSVLTQDSLLDILFVGAESYCFTVGRGLGGPDRVLEILACAEPCAGKPFEVLRAGVARRRSVLSGCICVLLGCDESRQSLLRQLDAAGLPRVAFAVVEPGSQPELVPAGVRRLEAGRIAEGLCVPWA